MSRLFGIALFLLLAAAGGYAALNLEVLLPGDTATSAGQPKAVATPLAKKSNPKSADGGPTPADVAELTDELQPAAPGDGSKPSLDISRVSPDGASVFAGQAPPNSYVTVIEDGQPVASVRADDTGSWSLVTEHRFASVDPKITLEASATPPPAAVAEAAPTPAPKSTGPTTAKDVADGLMKKFEDLVAKAREEAAERDAAEKAGGAAADGSDATRVAGARAQVDDPPGAAASGPVATAVPVDPNAPPAPTQPTPGGTPPKVVAQAKPTPTTSVAIPLPIMFVYNEATFTGEGRRAADLLLEYLRLKRADNVSLSGHADERGSDAYNMELSRERLDAVARVLRDGGFAGALDLVPKGKSEPFAGVDREHYAGEALYQLDRRVELRVVR